MFAEARADLVNDLREQTDYPVHPTWAGNGTLTLPALFVVPPQDAPYAEPGQFLGTWTIRFDVMALIDVGIKNNDELQSELETVVEAVLGLDSGWLINGATVDFPSTVPVEGAELFGTLIHLSTNTKL